VLEAEQQGAGDGCHALHWRAFLGEKLNLGCATWARRLQSDDGQQGGKSLGTRPVSKVLLQPLLGAKPTMLGVWFLLLLWGLAAPCQGLLETVGTLARIDKDELGKGELEAGGLGGLGLPVRAV
jgi:hypothetical protein